MAENKNYREHEAEKDGRRLLYIPVGVFVCFFAFFTIFSLVKPKSDFSEEENRALKELPQPDAESLVEGDFQKDYETYLSDQFPGRGFFVSVKTGVQVGLGKRDINGVYLGRGGYLIERYARGDFDRTKVDDNAWFVADFIGNMTETYGREHVQAMFIPSKDVVLSNFLPQFAEPFDSSYVVEWVRRYLREDFDLPADSVTDLTDTLKGQTGYPIYYRTDHHWTTLGAFFAYQKYKLLRGEQAPELENFHFIDVCDNFLGTSYDKVQLAFAADSVSRWEPEGGYGALIVDFNDGEDTWDSFYYEPALQEKDKYRYFLNGNTAKIHIHTSAENGKTLLLVKDSFSNSFVEYLAPDYEDIYMLDLRYTYDNVYELIDRIQAEKPVTDVLVLYNIEKFMEDNHMGQLEKLLDDEDDDEDDADDEDEDDEDDADDEDEDDADEDGEDEDDEDDSDDEDGADESENGVDGDE